MHKQRKAPEKRKTVILQLELLENRIFPATLDVTHFGSRSGGPGREYQVSDIYPNIGLPVGPTKFRGVNQPTAFFPTPAGMDYCVA